MQDCANINTWIVNVMVHLVAIIEAQHPVQHQTMADHKAISMTGVIESKEDVSNFNDLILKIMQNQSPKYMEIEHEYEMEYKFDPMDETNIEPGVEAEDEPVIAKTENSKIPKPTTAAVETAEGQQRPYKTTAPDAKAVNFGGRKFKTEVHQGNPTGSQSTEPALDTDFDTFKKDFMDFFEQVYRKKIENRTESIRTKEDEMKDRSNKPTFIEVGEDHGKVDKEHLLKDVHGVVLPFNQPKNKDLSRGTQNLSSTSLAESSKISPNCNTESKLSKDNNTMQQMPPWMTSKLGYIERGESIPQNLKTFFDLKESAMASSDKKIEPTDKVPKETTTNNETGIPAILRLIKLKSSKLNGEEVNEKKLCIDLEEADNLDEFINETMTVRLQETKDRSPFFKAVFANDKPNSENKFIDNKSPRGSWKIKNPNAPKNKSHTIRKCYGYRPNPIIIITNETSSY